VDISTIAVAGVAAIAIILIAIGIATSGSGSGISTRLERYASGKQETDKPAPTGQGPISDMLSRLETMVLMAGVDLPLRAIREQVASAVDLIVHQARLKDGSRRITNITEVQGMEGDVIVMQDVFVFEQTGVVEGKIQGRLKPTGIRPKFVEKFEVQGIHLPPGLFGFSY